MAADLSYQTGIYEGAPQWLRRATLKVSTKPGPGATTTMLRDLSELHFTFQVKCSIQTTPNICNVKIYNPSPDTADKIIKEGDYLYLTAGYQPKSDGLIFAGQIRQYRHGRDGTTDTFLELLASTAEISTSFGYLNVSLGSETAKASYGDWYDAICKSMNLARDSVSRQVITDSTGGRGFWPRGRAAFGKVSDQLDDLAKTIGAQWSVQTLNGVDTLVMLKAAQPRPGEAVILGPKTGLIGIPEATVDGVQVRCLLNPLLNVGSLVKVEGALITTTDTPLGRLQNPSAGTTDTFSVTAGLNASGFYCVMAVDYVGDTRGQDWYTDLTCLATDISTPKLEGGVSGSA